MRGANTFPLRNRLPNPDIGCDDHILSFLLSWVLSIFPLSFLGINKVRWRLCSVHHCERAIALRFEVVSPFFRGATDGDSAGDCSSLSESSLVRSFVCLCLFTYVAFLYCFYYLYCHIDMNLLYWFDYGLVLEYSDCKPCGKDFLPESRVKT